MRKIILISEGKIFLAPGHPFPISMTTFPASSISFSSRVHQYWEVDATNENGNLTFHVTNYHPTDILPFNKQIIKAPINSITFKKLDWQKFQLLLASYTRNAILPFLDISTIKVKTQPPKDHFVPDRYRPNIMNIGERIELSEGREIIHQENLQVSYEEARFKKWVC